MIKIRNFKEAEKFLSQVVLDQPQLFPGKLGIDRTLYLLSLLESPQNKLKVIHIAGTSGKGSTAYLISLILQSLGFKVGMYLSPHLLDIRERTQINNIFLSKQKFSYHLSQLLPCIEKVKQTSYGAPTYFEILTSLAFYVFWKEKVDYAVMETGLGGLYDATNVVDRSYKMSILTRIGFDHMQILGNTIDKIAYQKAHIIQKGNTVVSSWQPPEARRQIEIIVKKRNAKLYYIKSNFQFKNVHIDLKKTKFDFRFKDLAISRLQLGLVGLHQAENASIALAVSYLLSKRDKFLFDIKATRQALKNAHFPGRFDVKKINGKTIVIDGAHNPQKMESMLKSLTTIFQNQKFDFLLSFKKGKDYSKLLKLITPHAHKIALTSFATVTQDLIHYSENTSELEKILKKLKFDRYKIILDLKQALSTAIDSAENILVITGSLYFLSEVYPLLKKFDIEKSR